MTTALDMGRHVRVSKRPLPRAHATGVAALLEQERGHTLLLYRCGRTFVLVDLGWKLTEAEKRQVDAVAKGHKTPHQVAIAIAHELLCSVTVYEARITSAS